MQTDWNITIWGVRGSAPQTAAEQAGFGGNTTCISVDCGDELAVLDGGSGLSALGRSLASAGSGQRIHLLFSHLHLDHVMGLFSFPPFYDPEAELHLYGGTGFEKQLRLLLGPPFWPVGFPDFPARLSFHELQAGDSFSLEHLHIHTMAGNHPGGSLLYRLESGQAHTDAKKSLTYALDCEADDPTFRTLTEFSHGTDLLIWDACFVSEDLRPGWGHSTWEQGIRLRKAAGAKTVLMTHYGQNYSDSFLKQQEKKAAGIDPACRFAKEGMVITL